MKCFELARKLLSKFQNSFLYRSFLLLLTVFIIFKRLSAKIFAKLVIFAFFVFHIYYIIAFLNVKYVYKNIDNIYQHFYCKSINY